MYLPSSRYKEIKQIVADIIEDYDIRSIPIDVFQLADKMRIKIIKASQILSKNSEKMDCYSLMKYPAAVLLFGSDDEKRYMYLDDIGSNFVRQRFSVMHEIAHYILGHKEQSDQNETEANFFATYFLGPSSLSLLPDIMVNLKAIFIS